jgi:adenosylcobinamide kinase / adenosylcobinamide-phosphate guanylyltransferase
MEFPPINPMVPAIVLVTGPARSGKSEWAEHLADSSHRPVQYLATALTRPDDAEWQQRILHHQVRRPKDWQTVECPVDLAGAIALADPTHCLLVDSLGTWLANCLDQSNEDWQTTQQHLIQTLQTRSTLIIFVAEETGWGVVPAYPLGRSFRDRLGTLTRQIAALAQTTYLVTAGHALNLSQIATPLTAIAPNLLTKPQDLAPFSE